MKICQVIASRGNGGLEKHVRELSVALAEKGCELVVLGDASFLETLPDYITKEAIPTQLSRHNPFLLWQLYRKIKQHQPDIVHAQANKAVALMATLKNCLKLPLVGTLHNIKKNIKIFNKMDHVITVSKQLANRLDPARTTAIYNGIVFQTPQKQALHELFQLPPSKPVLCAVGRLVEAKGFDILINALVGLDVSLLISGEGPDKDKLQQQIETLNLSDKVFLLGHRSDVSAIMASADGIIIPSRREGFSYVFSEALLLDKPILACDVPVANELLPPELIVPTGDVQALHERLSQLLANLDQWYQLTHDVYQSAAPVLSLNAMVSHTLSVYNKQITTQ